MKYKVITLILALSAVAWAQTASQNPTPQASTPANPRADCACCNKAAAKDAHSCSCCAHHDMSAKDGNEAMSCCGKDIKSCCSGKDGMSCKRTDKDKTAANCGDCMKDHEKNCCATARDGDSKTGMSCCKQHCSAHASVKASS